MPEEEAGVPLRGRAEHGGKSGAKAVSFVVRLERDASAGGVWHGRCDLNRPTTAKRRKNIDARRECRRRAVPSAVENRGME